MGFTGVGGIAEGVKVNHVCRPVIGRFQDLGANVHKEGIGRPSSQDHDLVDGMIHEKEAHCGPGSDGPGAEVVCIVPEGGFATMEGAG